jgi:carboxymethylenebutenolidase
VERRELKLNRPEPISSAPPRCHKVRRFYSSYFVGYWPADTQIKQISRTVGQGSVIDELIVSFTHDMQMPAMPPGVAPTGRKVELPHVAIMGIENRKVAYKHIYWDQGSLFGQVSRSGQ